MSILTKNALSASNQASFPDNTTGAITPEILRNFNQSVIDTLVDSLNTGSFAITTGSNDFTQPNSFTSISASSFVSASGFAGDGSRLTNITSSIALPILDEGIPVGNATSMNFTGSNISAVVVGGVAIVQVTNPTGSLATTSSLNQLTASFNQFTSSTNLFTASQVTKDATLALYTASVDTKFNTLGYSTASLNAYTQSNDTKWSTLETTTASIQNSITALNQFTASDNTSQAALNAFTASQNTKNSTLATYTASVDQKFSNIGSQSGSWITESETGSFAVTNATNRFTSSQIFQSISASAEIKGTYFQGGYAYVDNINSQLANSDITMFLPAAYQFAVSSSISVTGAVTASFFKGDGSQLTNLPGQTPLTSLNTFTQSILGTNPWTASIDTKFSTLATQSGSWGAAAQVTSASFNAFTASMNSYTSSNDTKWSNLSTQTASNSASLNQLNAFTASQSTKNTTLGTYTASVDTKFATLGTQSGSWITESETGSFAYIDRSNAWSANQTFTNITAVSASFQYVQTTYETSSVIYSSGSNILGDAIDDTQTLIGLVRISGSQQITGSVGVTGNITMVNGSDIITHHVKAAGSNGLELQNASSGIIVSMGAGGGTQASFTGAVTANSVSASTITGIGNVTDYSTSVDARLDSLEALTSSIVPLTSLNAFTSSQQLLNTTFATTGSNKFVGNQTITGSVIISSSATYDLTVIDGMQVSGSTGRVTIGTSGFITTTPSTNVGSYVNVFSIAQSNTTTGDEFGFTLDTDAYGVSGWSGPAIYGNDPSDSYPAFLGFQNKSTWTDGRVSVLKPLVVSGSLSITGSAQGNVVSMSITSNTASMDFNKANYFELTASVSPLRINVTNLKGGVTSTLSISGSTASTITFSPNVQQPSGSLYTASVSGQTDILSFVAFNSSKVNVVSTIKMV